MRIGGRLGLVLGVAVLAWSGAAVEETISLDKGENSETKQIKEVTSADQRKAAALKQAKEKKRLLESVAYHLKQLKSSKDSEEKISACNFLAALNALIAVPDLIDVLRPNRQEQDNVRRAAQGALTKITGKNYSVKAYDEWLSFWQKEGTTLLHDMANKVPENDKIAAEAANATGLEMMHLGDYNAALDQFMVALNRNPKIPDFHNNAGLALMQMGRYLDAIEYFQETIGIKDDLPQPYLNIGRTYSNMGKSIEAQSWFKQAMEKDKKGAMWEIVWMIGKEYMKRAEYKMAYEYLDQARTKAEHLHKRDPRLYNDLAICHYGLDEYHSAYKELMNVKYLGFEPNEDFLGKVRQVLIAKGYDPEKEDEEARDHINKLLRGSDEESAPPPEALGTPLRNGKE